VTDKMMLNFCNCSGIKVSGLFAPLANKWLFNKWEVL